MNRGKRIATGLIVLGAAVANLFAGGSGLNVVVVVNQNSSNSLALGNYYCEQRGVPPQNVVRINWPGANDIWTKSDFETNLVSPLLGALASRQLTNQVDYILLSMDIPYRTTEITGSSVTSGANATTAALFYGFKLDDCSNCPANLPSCNLPAASRSFYAGSEGVFRQTPPISATNDSWLVLMLTSSNLAQAKAVVSRAVASDGTFPTQAVYLAKSTDLARNVRYLSFDDAIFNSRLRDNHPMQRTNTSVPNGLGQLRGYQGGLQNFGIDPDTFAPGAMADNLTSYGGDIFRTSDHALALAFLNAGAAGSFGTVVEPCNYLEKFPSPQNYFYQSRGFSLGECYYQSLTNPYQGLLVGEPLAAPFALPCSGAWSNLPAAARLAGTTNLTLQFSAPDAAHPVQQVDLFLDGKFAQTLTNVAPRQNNILYVTINGQPTNYTVPASATIKSVVSNLTAVLNTSTYSNATKVAAVAHGDRLELHSLDLDVPGAQLSLAVSNYPGPAAALTTFLAASRTNFLETIAFGRREITVAGSLVIGDYLNLTVTRTNGLVSTIAITNQSPTATFGDFLQSLVTAINAEPALQLADGLVAEDLVVSPVAGGEFISQFNLRARSPGLKESQIQALLEGTFTITPTITAGLDENLNDLQPRNHIYVTAGVTNLQLTFGLNTTTLADGFHELTAVAYEGSHVRTQKRVSQFIRITNTPLAATFSCLLCDTNTALEATLQFGVVANTSSISRIELFSTGGSWGVVSNSASATFSLAATNLGVGLHPFAVIVTRNDGKQYRTETKWIRLLGDEPPFSLRIAGSAPTLSWPATAGRRYEILSAVNPTNSFTIRDAITPTNSPGQWSETNSASNSRLYRVRSAP